MTAQMLIANGHNPDNVMSYSPSIGGRFVIAINQMRENQRVNNIIDNYMAVNVSGTEFNGYVNSLKSNFSKTRVEKLRRESIDNRSKKDTLKVFYDFRRAVLGI